MPRQRKPLVWGQGLDRSTGNLAADSATFLDLRNLLVRDQKLLAREGIVKVGDPFPTASDIVGGFPFRTNSGSVVVTYNRSTRNLHVWTIDGLGTSAVDIGAWATLPPDSPLPMVVAAEVYGKLILAHAEPLFNFRAKTIYFDPALTPGSQLVDLKSDFDGDGSAETIYFRGVAPYLSYLFGYGFGTGSDQNRPETIHVSLAGDPTTFDKQQYFQAGVRSEAVTGLIASGGQLRVQKKGTALSIEGTGPADFGIVELETLFGQVNDRIGLTLGGETIFWSEYGPRMVSGLSGTLVNRISVDIGLPLELDGPEPLTLTPAGQQEHGWLVYDPNQRIAIFGFPALETPVGKTRCYVVSRRNPSVITWTYFELQQTIYCAWLVVQGAASVGTTPTGYASDVLAVDSGQSDDGRTVTVGWTSHALIGGEVAQVFAKPDGGSWYIAGSGPAFDGDLDITGIQALQHHSLAVRFILGGVATAGYTSTDPDLWTASTEAGSKGDVVTTSEKPTDLSAVWSRTAMAAHQVDASFTLVEQDVGFRLQESLDGMSGWTDLDVESSPYNSRSVTVFPPDMLLGSLIYVRLRAENGPNSSPWSDVLPIFVGPNVSPELMAVVQNGDDAHFETWMREVGGGATKLEVQTSADGVTGWAAQFLSAIYTRKQSVLSPIALGSLTYVRARLLLTAFGVDDPGAWVSGGSIKLTNTAVPAAPAGTFGIFVGDNSISVGFGDPGAGLGTFLEYTKAADLLPVLSAVVPHPGVSHALTDIYDTGLTYDPRVYGSPPIPASFDLYTVDATSGQFKISAATNVSCYMNWDAPTSASVDTASPGQIDVNYIDAATTIQTGIFWFNDPPTSFGFNLCSMVASAAIGTSQTVTGPPGGLPALPADGSPIIVRIAHYNAGDSRWGLPAEVSWVMGT